MKPSKAFTREQCFSSFEDININGQAVSLNEKWKILYFLFLDKYRGLTYHIPLKLPFFTQNRRNNFIQEARITCLLFTFILLFDFAKDRISRHGVGTLASHISTPTRFHSRPGYTPSCDTSSSPRNLYQIRNRPHSCPGRQLPGLTPCPVTCNKNVNIKTNTVLVWLKARLIDKWVTSRLLSIISSLYRIACQRY